MPQTTNPTAQYGPTSFGTQSGPAYKALIDGNFAVLAQIAAAFQCYAASAPNMTVKVGAGSMLLRPGAAPVSQAEQASSTIVAPVGNPRIDRVVIDATTAVMSVITGTPAGSPVPPAVTTGKIPIAQILLQTTTTAITNSMITDERAGITVVPSGGGMAENDQASSYTLLGTDAGQYVKYTGGSNVTWGFTAAATLGKYWWAILANEGTGNVTLDPNASEQIDGLTSYLMYPGEQRLVMCDGTKFTSFVMQPFAISFTSSSSFTMPPGYGLVDFHLIGGGGAGAGSAVGPNAGSGGGGGGAGVWRQITPPPGGNTVTVTIGAGATGGAGAGAAGGTTTVSATGMTTLNAFGGGGGGAASATVRGGGGGGGGWSQAGANGTQSATVTAQQGDASASPGGQSGNQPPTPWNGIGGGGGGTVSQGGSDSLLGGGGGGGGGAAGTGGTGFDGGNGGSSVGSGTGGNGTAPGGGGAACGTGTNAGGGNGGAGKVWARGVI